MQRLQQQVACHGRPHWKRACAIHRAARLGQPEGADWHACGDTLRLHGVSGPFRAPRVLALGMLALQIRNAQADDRGPLAELIYSSGTDIYGYLHGARAVEFLRYELASGRGFAGHPHVLVAVLDGQVVGTGSFYDRAMHGLRSNEALKNMLGFHGLWSGVACVLRARNVGKAMGRPKPGELYLSNFGVAPQLRGRGIGAQLLAHRLAQARREGYTRFGLHVSSANPRAQALYERLGLSVTKDVPFPDARAGIAPGRKMELAL